MSALLSRRERINFALDRLQKGFLSEILCAARARVMNQALSPQYTTHRPYDSTDKPKKKCAKTCRQGSSRFTRSLDCVWSLVGMCMFVCTVQACNILTCNNYSRYQQDKNNSGDSKIRICRLLTCFRSGLPWSVDCNFDGFCIGGDLRWACRYRYGY